MGTNPVRGSSHHVMFRFLAAVMFAVALAPQGVEAAAVQTYPVVVQGDSMLWFGADELAAAHPDWLVDAVPGREPFEAAGSSWDAVEVNVPLVDVDGWFVFQDYGLDPATRQLVDEVAWTGLLEHVVELLPDDRCLAFVTPYATPTGLGYRASRPDVTHTQLMLDTIEGQPCHAVVRWDLAADREPALIGADGLHPSPAGVEWLNTAIEAAVTSSLYVPEAELQVIVEEWREDNRPDLEFEPMFEVAVTYCTDETEPMILAMLIDNGDIAGNLLDFLTDVCPQVIAAADAAL